MSALLQKDISIRTSACWVYLKSKQGGLQLVACVAGEHSSRGEPNGRGVHWWALIRGLTVRFPLWRRRSEGLRTGLASCTWPSPHRLIGVFGFPLAWIQNLMSRKPHMRKSWKTVLIHQTTRHLAQAVEIARPTEINFLNTGRGQCDWKW